MHRFKTHPLEESKIEPASGRYYLRVGQDAHLHINPTNPADSVFEANAQLEIYRPKTASARFLAASCGALCFIAGTLHYFDRRRFHRKARA